jgi:capsular polysaccharide transport system permease protein
MDLDQVFARRGGDWFFSMSSGLPIEDQVDYWNGMVNVEYDHSSGIIAVTVKAFTPQDAKAIADEVVRNSEQLINELSAAARAEVVQAASNEVMAAELRLRETRRRCAPTATRPRKSIPSRRRAWQRS